MLFNVDDQDYVIIHKIDPPLLYNSENTKSQKILLECQNSFSSTVTLNPCGSVICHQLKLTFMN